MFKNYIWKLKYKVNRRYKDRVFCFLFGEEQFKKNALSLYNAVNGTDYTDEKELVLYTLADALYMKMKNDVSYLFHNTISLYEHQSSPNPNMPLRGFMYFGEMYSKFIEQNKLNMYGETLIKIPNPQYYVFYNGEKSYPDQIDLRLSDAFFMEDNSGKFQWTATVVNINNPDNDIRKKCTILNEYMLFVEKIRKYSRTMAIQDAVDQAVQECIRENILRDILVGYKAEVSKMCITEFNEEVYKKGIREEVYQEYRPLLEEKDAELSKKDAELSKKDEELLKKEEAIAIKDKAIAEHEARIAELEALLAKKK